jgi:NAD(P)-dependent dehydrogenase (short-subunit alcohol dehydrogenase family)
MPAGPKPVTCDPSTENDDKSGLLPTALVTGGAVRVGRILALALAELGFAVAIHCNRATEAAEALAGTIEQEGGRAVVVKGDLAEPGTAAAVVAAAVQGLGEPLGMLVNNAALFVADSLPTLDPATLRRQLAVNLEAPALLAQSYVAQLPAAAPGLVVNLSDQRVANPTAHYLSYSISKAGLEMLTAVLARSLAPRIRAVNLALGQALPAPGMDPARFAELVLATPLGRATSAGEIGRALQLIVRSPSMTGTTLTLDSGLATGWLTPS